MRSPFVSSLLAIALALATVSPAAAKECEDVTMPDRITVDGTALVLNGMGVREATVLSVNVYVAGLYVEQRSRDGAALVQAPGKKRLILHFVRDVSKSDITGAFDESFQHTAGNGIAALRPRIQRLFGFMPAEVHEGDEMTFTYLPGRGVEVRVGRQTKGVIEGDDFARAFLSIWLGTRPPNAGLKRGLLGGECG